MMKFMQREGADPAMEDSNKDNRTNKHTAQTEPLKNKTSSIQVSSTVERT
jgi:hypothetical protein